MNTDLWRPHFGRWLQENNVHGWRQRMDADIIGGIFECASRAGYHR